MRRSLLVLLLLTLTSCDDSGTSLDPRCEHVPLSNHLKRVFYWGFDTPSNMVPNTGVDASDVWSPQWISPDTILVASTMLNNGVVIDGVFAVGMNPATFDYLGVSAYSHTTPISSISYDSVHKDLFLIDSPAPQGRRLLRCRLTSAGVLVDEELAGSAINPRHITVWPGRRGVLFSALNPLSLNVEVFWRGHGTAVDSLVYISPDSVGLTGDFSIAADASKLLVAADAFDRRTTYLLSVPLASGSQPTVVAQREHMGICVVAHALDADVSVFSYRFVGDSTRPPEDIVEVLRLSTGASKRLNVRTHAPVCRFPLNDLVAWDPTGQHVALSSAARSDEGDLYSFMLWVYVDVPNPNTARS